LQFQVGLIPPVVGLEDLLKEMMDDINYQRVEGKNNFNR